MPDDGNVVALDRERAASLLIERDYLPRRAVLMKAVRKFADRINGIDSEAFGEARAVARLASAELDDAVYPGVTAAFQLDAELLAAALELVRLNEKAVALDAHVADCAAAARTWLRASEAARSAADLGPFHEAAYAAAQKILAEGYGEGVDESSPARETAPGLRYRS